MVSKEKVSELRVKFPIAFSFSST